MAFKNKLYSKKMVEIVEDSDRIYFTFFPDTGQKVISVPKNNCPNQNIYVGTSLNNLVLAQGANVPQLLNSAMKIALQAHPRISECQSNCIKLLTQ